MSKSSGRKIFVNLAVRDLKRAKAFFPALGLDFNPKFSDDNGAWMDPKAVELGPQAYLASQQQ